MTTQAETQHTINVVYIYAPQDPSVGMRSVSLAIGLNGYETDDLEFVRSQIAQCFGALYDDTVQVTFDFEWVQE
jgi:hypothetical protein